MSDTCTCPWNPPSSWTVFYGAIEPGSTQEYNPTCPVHGDQVDTDDCQCDDCIDPGDDDE